MGILTLKCEKCGLYYAREDEDDDGSYDSIDETGVCLSCRDELNVKIII